MADGLGGLATRQAQMTLPRRARGRLRRDHEGQVVVQKSLFSFDVTSCPTLSGVDELASPNVVDVFHHDLRAERATKTLIAVGRREAAFGATGRRSAERALVGGAGAARQGARSPCASMHLVGERVTVTRGYLILLMRA